jgi:hypothetical protein
MKNAIPFECREIPKPPQGTGLLSWTGVSSGPVRADVAVSARVGSLKAATVEKSFDGLGYRAGD